MTVKNFPFTVVIPARFSASRLPGKPLKIIGDKPMICHVVDRAVQSGAESIVVATDDLRIAQALNNSPCDICLTRADHPSGSDRLAEVVKIKQWTPERIVVNVQGDEPFIDPSLIRQVAYALQQHATASMATAVHPIKDVAKIQDSNVVKALLNQNNEALYFSRAAVPFCRDDGKQTPILQHIGIYAYTAKFIEIFSKLAPTPLEQTEKLEQLRALEHGYKIAVSVYNNAIVNGVDTEQDLIAARLWYEQHQGAAL